MQKTFKKFQSVFVLLSILTGCSSPSIQKIVIETSAPKKPDWVLNEFSIWEQDQSLFIRSNYSIRGDERLNGCLDLAKLESRESILTEISISIRGELDQIQQSLNEDAELLLGKSRSSSFSGKVIGLRFVSQYYERSRIGTTDRVECFVLGQIRLEDLKKIKNALYSELIGVDPNLKAALKAKQIEFIQNKSSAPVDASGTAEAKHAPAAPADIKNP